MLLSTLITSDPEIVGGQSVFAGTRVPVESLFDYLEAGISLDEFLAEFPSVTREQVVQVNGNSRSADFSRPASAAD